MGHAEDYIRRHKMKLIDTTLGLNKQAEVLMHVLDYLDPGLPDTVFVETGAWYNGRERGVSLDVKKGWNGESLYVCWFEHRNGDSVCVSSWIGASLVNPPTWKDRPEAAYEAQAYFPVGRYFEAAKHIIDLIQDYIQLRAIEG